MEKYFGIYYSLCIVWYLAFIGIMTYLYFNDSRPYTTKVKGKIYRQIPSRLHPGELSNLLYKKIVPEVFTATILVLLKKGVLELKKTKNSHIIVLGKQEYKLSHSQKLVCNILINDMGNGEQVTFKQIEDYCNSSHSCSEFLFNYQMWVKMMIKESNKKRFYEDKREYNQVKSIRLLGVILFILNIVMGYNSPIGYFIIIPSLFIVLYFYKIFKRTEVANEEYTKWLAFKRYLQGIDKFKYNKEEIDNYIIYGLILKLPSLEQKLRDNHYAETLNSFINHNVVSANLRGSRGFKNK